MTQRCPACLGAALVALALGWAGPAAATCASFDGSTMNVTGVAPAEWRTDFPALSTTPPETPWAAHDFDTDPRAYMFAVLDTVRPDISRKDRRLVGTGDEDWWIVPWMDYTDSGREPFMGLTRERRAQAGDLSPDSSDGIQVWAVGFYNAPGAAVVGKIFADPCDPVFPDAVSFPEGTVSVKFLFTDAPTDEVSYLEEAPTYDALIDPPSGGDSVTERTLREVRLLQVDIAVRDSRADPVGWVFGTFVWLGLPRGDQLFDNLEPVSLQWGDDPDLTAEGPLAESWINEPVLKGVLYGWPERPWLGFLGRANGPADNAFSSCLSCHASSRLPSIPSRRLAGDGVDMTDPVGVAEHLDVWFINLPAGEVFYPDLGQPDAVALDYSLQLDAAIWRMCRACNDGKPAGDTPQACLDSGYYPKATCGTPLVPGGGGAVPHMADTDVDERLLDLLDYIAEREGSLPRQ
jgi:hypothetical protein